LLIENEEEAKKYAFKFVDISPPLDNPEMIELIYLWRNWYGKRWRYEEIISLYNILE
jgi:hypothetical protein